MLMLVELGELSDHPATSSPSTRDPMTRISTARVHRVDVLDGAPENVSE